MRLLFSYYLLFALAGAASAQSLIINGDLETDPFPDGWVVSVDVEPFGGLTADSSQSAAFSSGGHMGQDVFASGNWFLEASFAVKPLPEGNPSARLFSLFVNTVADSANNVNTATINLRYQGGKFEAYNGAIWVDTGLGSIASSVDANEDGDFDDAGDTKNVYRIRLTGSNWGMGADASSYTIQLSDVNAIAFTKQTGSLRIYQAGSGDNSPPAAFIFNASFGSNPGFYVDDVVMEDIELPDDPDLAVVSPPPVIKLVPVGETTATGLVTVRNNGAAENLTITGATFAGPDAAKFSATASFPMMLPPGETGDVQVDFDSGGPNSGSFTATLQLASNDPGDPVNSINAPVRLFAMNEVLLTNGGFEATPYNEGWSVLGTVEPIAGLAGSAQAAHIIGPASGGDNPSLIGRSVVSPSDWRLEASFLTLAEEGHTFQIAVSTFGEPTRLDSLAVNLRYQDGFFALAQPGAWSEEDLGLGTLESSIDDNADGDFNDPRDIVNLYRFRLTGRAWGTDEASLDVELTEPNGSAFTRVLSGWNLFPGGTASGINGPPVSIIFSASAPEHVGQIIDNITFLAGAFDPTVPPAPDFGITAFSISGNTASLTWDNNAGGTYRVESSTSLLLNSWTSLDSGLSGPAYNFTLPAPAPSVLFYRVFKE